MVKPQIIVIEGVSFNKHLNPILYNFVGEGAFAVENGKRYGCDYVGIEEVIINELSKKYKKNDILGYDFMRTSKLYYKTFKKSKNDLLKDLISYDYSKCRDIFNIINLYRIINLYDNILCIMGETHVYAYKDTLMESFGKR